MSRSGALYMSQGGAMQGVLPGTGSQINPQNTTAYSTVVNPPDATARFASFWVPGAAPRAFDRISIVTVTTSGAAGAVCRLGIYGDGGGFQPGPLVLDAGTVDTTVAPGTLSVVINQSLPGGLYWLCAAPQGAPATHPTIRTCSAGLHLVASGGAGSTINIGWSNGTGFAGALPASVSGSSQTAAPFAVYLRAA